MVFRSYEWCFQVNTCFQINNRVSKPLFIGESGQGSTGSDPCFPAYNCDLGSCKRIDQSRKVRTNSDVSNSWIFDRIDAKFISKYPKSYSNNDKHWMSHQRGRYCSHSKWRSSTRCRSRGHSKFISIMTTKNLLIIWKITVNFKTS